MTWFGCGLVPKAPGTMGTLGTVPLAWYMSSSTTLLHRVALATFITIIACALSGWDQKDNAVKDPQYIVIDETAGLLWSCLLIPANWKYHAIAFGLFRLFDILKPFPGNWFDRQSKVTPSAWFRGVCIVFDDVVAGFYALACLAALPWIRSFL